MQTDRPQVLLADGDETASRELSDVLRDGGFSVAIAADARRAVALLESGTEFDAIVTELTLPGVDGVELLRQVRQSAPMLPLLVVTGQPSLDSAIAAVEQSAFRYFSKPVSAQTVLEAVKAASAMCRLSKLKQQALELCESGSWPLSGMNKLAKSFRRALDRLWIAFQPIVHWPTRSVFGYEALVRCSDPSFPHPGALFDAAERLDCTVELGQRIQHLIAARAPEVIGRGTLFVNLHPADLDDPEIFSPASPLAPHADKVVLELTERQSLENVSGLRPRMARLRELGYRLAVDDLGAGYAGLSAFSQLEPDVVKLDMSLVRGVDQSPRKRSIVRSMLSVCSHELGTVVICEGVETAAERDTLIDLGAQFLQGYLFGRPAAELAGGNPTVFLRERGRP